MNEEEIRRITREVADAAAKKAVRETLTAIGIDSESPFEFQEQMQFVRTLRAAIAVAGRQALTAFVGFASVGVAWAIWAQIGGN